ncbi:MAG: hypothetical protein ACTHJM_04605 [Marmoricola sp.]
MTALCSTLSKRSSLASAGVLAVVSALLAACGTAAGPAPVPRTTVSQTTQRVAPVVAQQALLRARAEGIRTHNLTLFLSGDDPTQKAFIERDRRYFAAVAALPWATFSYRVTTTPWPQQLIDRHWGAVVRLPQVVLTTQLAGFDTNPVSRTTGFAFVTHGGRTFIASDRTIHDHLFPGYQPDPWDVEPVTVVRSANAIGVFDNGALAQQQAIMATLGKAIAGVSKDVPYPWTKNVVLYAMTGSGFPTALTAMGGGDLAHLGAVTYPLDPNAPGADSRVLLLDDALNSGSTSLSRTIRHEVTHVALGDESNGVPLWLIEGIAEYEGAKSVPAAQRRISEVAIQRAGQRITGMPASATFHDADQDWHYAVSWMACQYIVQTGGEPLLWSLLDALYNGGLGTTDAHQDLILDQVLGMNSAQLAVHAVGLIRSTYG